MKKILYLFILLLLIIIVPSCGKDKASIKITTSSKILDAKNPIDINIDVTNSKDDYIISYSDDTLVELKGNQLFIDREVEEDTLLTIKACLNNNQNIFDEVEIIVKSTIYGLVCPTNIEISPDGLITWDYIENASSYLVKINSNVKEVQDNYYQVGSVYNDFNYSVASKNDVEVSNFSVVYHFNAKDPYENVSVGIKSGSEIKSGQSLQLTASVTNAGSQTDVEWEVVEGSDFARISESGLLSCDDVNDELSIKVRAWAKVNPKNYAEKVINVVTKPILTQSMLDSLSGDKIGFEGYINISLYTLAIFPKLYNTYVIVVKTAMDGKNWYAEYENTATGLTQGLYIQNHNNLACEVGVSFTNEESYLPMKDKYNQDVTFKDSGLYNNFKGLKVSDFTFNPDTWRYEYTGSDKDLDERMISSANPYDFKANGFSLVIEDEEIMGIYATSDDDYGIVSGYKAIQELIVAVNYDNTVDVKTISKYPHDERHDILNNAVEKMKNLDSYTLKYNEISASYYTNGYAMSGFKETITDDLCNFVPFTVKYDSYGNEIETYDEKGFYGYKKINDNLYNAYFNNDITPKDKFGEKVYKIEASRAFENDFSFAKPSFEFAGEIFNQIYYDEQEETYTFYVDKIMSSVASTFFYGVGNDINLYGIFATEGYVNNGTMLPYVTVSKEGYIIESGFYFNISYIYGYVTITYSDFNTTTSPENIDFETRLVPTSWNELIITASDESSSTEDDYDVNAEEFLKEFFKDENIIEKMPFFGSVLGDTYGFGLSTIKINSQNQSKHAIVFYYDVPLDTDYTIDSSLKACYDYLISLGFEKNEADEYESDTIVVQVVDSSLDLMIYVWAK